MWLGNAVTSSTLHADPPIQRNHRCILHQKENREKKLKDISNISLVFYVRIILQGHDRLFLQATLYRWSFNGLAILIPPLLPAVATGLALTASRVQLKCDGPRWQQGRGNWRKKWVASTFHTTSEHGVSSITTADAHTSAASSRLNWRHRRFNPLQHNAGCETGWAIDAFAVNSSFLSVDGITCLIPFKSWRNGLSNGISYI